MVKQHLKLQKIKSKSDEKSDTSVGQKSPVAKESSQKNPQTMEELLQLTGYTLLGLKKGSVVEGKVASVSPKEITIDIGRKTEAVVIDKELETYRDVLMKL